MAKCTICEKTSQQQHTSEYMKNSLHHQQLPLIHHLQERFKVSAAHPQKHPAKIVCIATQKSLDEQIAESEIPFNNSAHSY